ncbi:MAG: DUF3999 family protein, partial [Gammaproteobacteria bacterium]|nr:DUF3999 family protein [Gammaproteobacteria bacterium]
KQIRGAVELSTERGDRGYHARIRGVVETAEGKVTRLDIVALGEFWGEGPFTLAYGNANLKETVKPVGALLKILNDSERGELVDVATPGETITLLGKAALKPDRSIPWERIFLWTILTLGVLVIGSMALRLFRQMNANRE